MTTDYRNLTPFEGAAVVMITLGVFLIGFQIFTALPENAKVSVSRSLEVFEMSGAVADVWETQLLVNNYVVGGMADFQKEFSLAALEVFDPVGENLKLAASESSILTQIWKTSEEKINVAVMGFMELGEILASNYQNNYVMSGVEAGVGGKVMGAYFEQLTE